MNLKNFWFLHGLLAVLELNYLTFRAEYSMNLTSLLVLLVGLAIFSFFFGRRRSYMASSKSGVSLHSLPHYYGFMVALWTALPALVLLFIWLILESSIIHSLWVSQLPAAMQGLSSADLGLLMNKVSLLAKEGTPENIGDADTRQAVENLMGLQNNSVYLKSGLVILVAIGGFIFGLNKISAEFRARNAVEKIIRGILLICSLIAIVTTIGILLSVLFEALQFFRHVPVTEFLFGTVWNPTTEKFGAVPLFAGTLLVAAVALIISVPLGLLSAVYLSEYASQRFRSIAKPVLEILSGIPTVVYGFFAALTVGPFVRDIAQAVGLEGSTESALAAGSVMGVMLIPFISSISDDVMTAVPRSLRDGSYGLGATQSETITKVIFPAALPGIVGGILLAASRAIGETMIVVMAAGLAGNITGNPLEPVTTVTVQIVMALTGDQEFGSPETLVAFALALTLFFSTLLLNIFALNIVKKYREAYD